MSRRKPAQAPKSEQTRWGPYIVALIGALAVIAAAIITRPAAPGDPAPPTPDRSPRVIAFAAPGDPRALNPALLWEKGSSPGSGYTLDGGALTLTAGAHTWPGFPSIVYTEPLSGSFDAQVKAVFKPPVMEIDNAQMVGLLVRPVNARLVGGDERFPGNWMVVSKQLVDAGMIAGCRGSWRDYTAEAVYLRIERDAESWRCAYSEDGETWQRMRSDVDAAALQGVPLELALFAYSGTGGPITVEFSEWTLTRK